MLKGIPLEKTKVTCEVAQKINQEIVKGVHPEDEYLEAAVIAHTLICANCGYRFIKASLEYEETQKPLEPIWVSIFVNIYESCQYNQSRVLAEIGIEEIGLS